VARSRTRTFRVVPEDPKKWDLFLKDFLAGLEDVEAGAITDFAETTRDTVAAFITNGTGITWSHSDGANTLTGTVSLAAFSTTNLAEGTNLYFTDERAQDAVGAALAATSTIALSYADPTPAITADIVAGSVSNTHLTDMAADTIKGRANGAGSGDPTDLSAAQVATIISSAIASALNITSGVYTPTLTAVINVAASTQLQCQYVRIGSVVIVSGRLSVDPTAVGATELGISLPIASNFGAVEDCGGVGFANASDGLGAAIVADTTNDRATMVWVQSDAANRSMSIIFMYRVI